MSEQLKPIAQWDITLYVTCPNCERCFDLFKNMDYEDLPDVAEFCNDLEIECIECDQEFTADVRY